MSLNQKEAVPTCVLHSWDDNKIKKEAILNIEQLITLAIAEPVHLVSVGFVTLQQLHMLKSEQQSRWESKSPLIKFCFFLLA